MKDQLSDKIKRAVAGDKNALEEVIKSVQDLIYNLAVKMLWHPEEAKDASQEILIRLVTNLGKFEHKSSFQTWVYRLAANHLINYRNKNFRMNIDFEQHAGLLKENLSDQITYTTNIAEKRLLVEEAKVGCSNAMLQCLPPRQRMVYLVGEILDFNSLEGAAVLELSPENFRQLLSRSRKSIRAYLNGHCGLVNKNNPCRCHKRVDEAIRQQLIDPKDLLFTKNKQSDTLIEHIDRLDEAARIHQTNANYQAPEQLIREIRKVVAEAPFSN